MTSRTTFRTLFLFLTLSAATAPASAQTYLGVGGCYEQQIAAIQRNSTLASNGTDTVVASTSTRRVFVRFLADTGRNVTGFDIKMRYRYLGEVVRAWLYTANASNAPATAVASGEIGIGTDAHFCRASFRDPYRVAANTLYFMAFELPVGEDLILSTTSGGPATTVTWFVTASGAARNAGLQFRVNADGRSPAISMTQPRIGSTYTVSLTGASIGDGAALVTSHQPPRPALDLHSFGAPGSFLYLATADEVTFVSGEPDRTRSLVRTVPNDPRLIGLPVNLQWAVFTTNNALGFVMSDAALTAVQ